MPNTQNEQVKTDTSFEENYIDENVSVKTNKTKEFIKKFMKRKTAVAAFFVMCFLLLMALFGPSLAPYAPEAYDYDNILAGPSASHLFGTDQYGRDIFSRILAGTPLTLGVSPVSYTHLDVYKRQEPAGPSPHGYRWGSR